MLSNTLWCVFPYALWKRKAFWVPQLQTFVIASPPAYLGVRESQKAKTDWKDRARAKAAAEAIQKSHTTGWCLLQKIFESLWKEEVLIMTVIKETIKKIGIKSPVSEGIFWLQPIQVLLSPSYQPVVWSLFHSLYPSTQLPSVLPVDLWREPLA